MTEKKELSQLAKTILSGAGHITTFTQKEFDDALALAKAEIMMVAIETTKTAIMIEREECAKVALQGTGKAVQTQVLEAIKAERQRIYNAILNRIPSQRQ